MNADPKHQPPSWRAQDGEPEMELIDGPLAGFIVAVHRGVDTITFPEMDGDHHHFIKHTYWYDGTWKDSSTFVGYESDEKIARNKAIDEWMYWRDREARSDDSFV